MIIEILGIVGIVYLALIVVVMIINSIIIKYIGDSNCSHDCDQGRRCSCCGGKGEQDGI